MVNDGKEYEKFVGKLQQAILDSEPYAEQKNIKVEINKKIMDNCGVKRQFDVYWEYELGGLIYKTIIECKDYETGIPIEKLDALIGKLKDIPDLRPIIATKNKYQSGAIKKAAHNKIDILIIREQNDSDWMDEEGVPFIKKIHLNINIQMPPRIKNFVPFCNYEWAKENADVDLTKPIEFSAMNNEIFIDDIETGEYYSLLELEARLQPIGSAGHGEFKKTEHFENAFIHYSGKKYKLDRYVVEYTISQPHLNPIEIDFSGELIGVIEYLHRGTKKKIFKDGKIR